MAGAPAPQAPPNNAGDSQHHTGCKRYRRSFSSQGSVSGRLQRFFQAVLHQTCILVHISNLCEPAATAQGHVRRAASWTRLGALPTLPGRFRAMKLRTAVDTCCDWSMLRKARPWYHFGCWLVDVTRSPAHRVRRPKGVVCHLPCSPEAAWRLARTSACLPNPAASVLLRHCRCV